MRNTITLIGKSTLGASLRGVPGVYQAYQDAGQSGFVLDKLAQLVESPGVLLSPLALANRDSGTDTREVFKGNPPSSVFSLRNNTLADNMVNVGGKPSLSFRTLLQKLLCRLGVVGLEPGTEFRVTLSKPVDLSPGVGLAVGVSSDIDDAKVNSQEAVRVIRRWLRRIKHSGKIEHTISQDKVGLPHLPVKPRLLIGTNPDRHYLPPAKAENRHLIQPLPGQDTLVVDHSRVGLEEMPSGSVCLVAIDHLSDGPDSHLGRESVVLTEITIDQPMQVHLAEGTGIKGYLRGIVASLVEPLHRLQECLMLLRGGCQFYHQGLLHALIVDYINPQVKEREVGAFLCRLKTAVSCA
ncbi:hypothetical protein ES703_119212 [subsurface metagenome]